MKLKVNYLFPKNKLFLKGHNESEVVNSDYQMNSLMSTACFLPPLLL